MGRCLRQKLREKRERKGVREGWEGEEEKGKERERRQREREGEREIMTDIEALSERERERAYVYPCKYPLGIASATDTK